MRWWRYSVWLWAAVHLAAQPKAVTVVGATSTQLLVQYQAPDLKSCSLQAVNLDDPQVIVHDVDPIKFAGADSDSRHSWNVGVLKRVVVIGKRASDTGIDGKLYSRALEADASHRVQITCGGQTVSVDAQTDWLPAGDLFPDSPPFNKDGLGNYAWPTINWSDRSRPYIDPMTGVKIKFASFPGDWSNKTIGAFSPGFTTDLSGNRRWAAPENAASGGTSAMSTYSGAGNEALFVGVDPALSNAHLLYGGWGGGEPPRSIDDFGVHVFGAGTDAAAENRTVRFCLSIDSGQSCYTKEFDVVLPQNAPTDSGVVPSNFPTPMFAGWDKPVLRAQMPTFGTVDVDANVATLTGTEAGSTFFNASLARGSKIHIDGSAPACDRNLCTILEVQDGSHLLLAETLQVTGAATTLANFGVRVVKRTGTGSVSLSLSYEFAWSFPVAMPVTGSSDLCGKIPVPVRVDAAGRPLPNGQILTGYNCSINGNWYWISSDTGESRLISLTNVPQRSEFSGLNPQDIPNRFQAPQGVAAFDAVDPNAAYVYAYLEAGGVSLFKLTYTGDYRAFSYNYPTGGGGELPNNVSDSIQWVNITPVSLGKDPTTQVQNLFPDYNLQRFGEVRDFRGISGSYAMFIQNLGGQDTPCWIFLMNLKTQVMEYGFNSWDGTFDPFLRWQGCHFAGAGSMTNTATIANKPIYVRSSNINYGGPYQTKVSGVLRKDGTFDATTTLTSDPDGTYEDACPGGLVQQFADLSGSQRCVSVRVTGEPCSAFATAQEKSWSPCPTDESKSMLQTMEVGDYVADANPTPGYLDQERLIIVRKTVISPTLIELVLQRLPGPYCGSLDFQRRHTDGWSIEMVASGPLTCEGGFLVMDIPSKKIYAENRFLISGHFDYGVGSPSGYGFIGQGYAGPYPVYMIREKMAVGDVGAAPTGYVTYDPRFSGVSGLPFGALQSYSSKHQWTADADDLRWALDFRHLNGSYGIAQESAYTGIALTTTTKVSGTKNVYMTSIAGDVNVKKIPLLGYAGRYLLQEKSSSAKGDTLTDADAFRFCYAYSDGECRQDAKAGQAYVSVPGATITGACQSAQYARNIPCLMTAHPLGAWATQFETTTSDLSGVAFRRLTMGLTGPGRQYAYGNLRALPDGKWALMSGWWIDGLREDVLLVKIPSLHSSAPISSRRTRGITPRVAHDDFVGVDVQVSPMSGAARAVVDFGYGEYGQPTDFYCTARSERCSITDGDPTQPFLYAGEKPAGVSCTMGCTIRISALAARTLYYQIRYLDQNGGTIQTSPLQIRVSWEERFGASGAVAVPQ